MEMVKLQSLCAATRNGKPSWKSLKASWKHTHKNYHLIELFHFKIYIQKANLEALFIHLSLQQYSSGAKIEAT